MNSTPATLIISLLSIGLSNLALAQQPGGRQGPPMEALQACSGKAVNNSCSFQSPHGQLQGQCVTTPHNQLACLPAGHRPPPGHAPGQGGQNNGQRGQQPGNNQQSRNGPPPMRTHTVVQTNGKPTLVPANQQPPAANQVSISVQGDTRIIQSNGISRHLTGQFPNSGNPNVISSQQHVFRVPAQPQLSGKTHETRIGKFGVAVNGVPFEPGAAETFAGDHSWHYEALSGAVALGIDANYAHVQPTGTYHYHGLPTGLMQQLGINPGQHSALVGWASDGFPIYALYGYQQAKNPSSGIGEMRSSYRVKQGQRTGGNQPTGQYDGTFVKDYEYIAGSGSLDECNGRMAVTPEFPQGTYAYFLTRDFPVIPRCSKGTPSADFRPRLPGLR